MYTVISEKQENIEIPAISKACILYDFDYIRY